LAASLALLAPSTPALAEQEGEVCPAPLVYSPSAYELAPSLQRPCSPWTEQELKKALLDRLAVEKKRTQMDVNYYRIGYTLSFPLPLVRRPDLQELPVPIPKMTYPWLIWLSWDLEERWRLLHAGWRQFGDREAGLLLQHELAALSQWDHFAEVDGNVGLLTGHLAAGLSLALKDGSGWDAEALRQTRGAAEALIERDVWPWFKGHWSKPTLEPEDLINIPVIALVRAAQLARVIDSPRKEALETQACQVLRAWYKFRLGPRHHTEGTAYDGYLMDSITEWMADLPAGSGLLQEGREPFRSLGEQWLYLTLPGRADLHAPLGDVEPEMTFWANALVRLAGWYEWPDAAWLLRRTPLSRLRAGALTAAFEQSSFGKLQSTTPASGPQEVANALTLRTGWHATDLLAVLALSRSQMHHLHSDSGQLILGWQGRFWITDPGYQQYRPGEERDYTLGLQAHNAPVLGGAVQRERAARLALLETDSRGWQHARADLSQCYRGLAPGARVQRDLWLLSAPARVAVARDTLAGLGKSVDVTTSWQLGAQLALTFQKGWLRLSDGERTLWMGTFPGQIEASELSRHPGSRGTLTLTCKASLPDGIGARWWVFWCEPNTRWLPPSITVEQGRLSLTPPDGGATVGPLE
jgi:hypothetical protein